ncbi:MAG: methyltransferase RsmF C-terminal domain-like protein [Chitinophagaceae bacterium]
MPNNLPIEFITSLHNIKGFNKETFVKAHSSGEQVTSIRINPSKFSMVNCQFSIENIQLSINGKVPWCSQGFYLSERPSFTFDPLFHAGVYYVQEASSMFLWHVLGQTIQHKKNLKILDLCAAPGGKTTLLASYFNDGLIVGNEIIKSRVNVLIENVTKWGNENVVVTNNEAKDFQRLENYFDIIVVDAPCSGSGLFRKNNDAINEWSEENVKLCNLRQQRIIADVYPALKQYGVLIYSTCSYSKEENEDVCDWLIKSYNLSTINCQLSTDWGIIEVQSDKNKAYGYRFYPDKLKGEGFFIAAFKKNDGDNFHPQTKSSLTIPSKQEKKIALDWIRKDANIFFIKQKEKILAIPSQLIDEISLLQKHLYLRKVGVAIGSLKNADFIPEHELALSLLVNDDVKKIELNKEQAIEYLQKKDLQINFLTKGWALATYQNINLGWMKVLQNRMNNYYPVQWRILKQ